MRQVFHTDRTPDEKGAVLITVLLLVTFMSTMAVAMMDDIRSGIRQTANVRLVNQAHWFARGADELAEQAIVLSWQNDPGRSTLNDVWAKGPAIFPVDGGYIEGRIVDRSNCFNLNSVVEGDGENRYVQKLEGRQKFRALLTAIGLGEGEVDGLTGALVDWIDTDGAPTSRGAEDAYYMSLPLSYRAANTSVVQVTELRALRGYSEEVYQRILPFVCAQPDSDPSSLNVNTLMPEQAPLLVALVGEELTEAAARQVIQERPDDGFLSLNEFWSHRVFAGIGISEQIKGQVSVRTRYFESRADVVLGQAFVSVTTLFEQVSDGSVLKVSRHQGMAP